MNDEEINAMAMGIFMYLKKECKDPVNALAVILCLVLIYYEQAKDPTKDYPIEDFAKSFGNDIVIHWATRTSETIQ